MVRASSNGQLDISYVSDVVPDTQVLEAVKSRQLNLGFMGVHYQPEMALMNFQSLPIVPNNRLPEILALLKPQFSAIWEQQWGVKLLAFSYYLPQFLFTHKPVDTLASLQDQRIRQFNAQAIKLYAGAGAVPVQLQHVSMVLPNLLEGKLDGAQGALPAYVNWGWAQHLKYISNWPLGSTYMALIVNLDDWNALPPELQSKLMNAAEVLETNQWRSRQAYIDALLNEAHTKYGATVVNPAAAQVAALLSHVGPVLDEWQAQTGPASAPVLAAINQVLGTHYQ
jgi:TRAP-type C4-dicarboxylate transport system substrate-binding protein